MKHRVKKAFAIKFNFSVISDCVLNSVFCLLALNLLIFIISVLIIALFGFDCLTSMTAVSATLTNSGPGLGQIHVRVIIKMISRKKKQQQKTCILSSAMSLK